MARRKNPDTKTMLLIGGGALLVYLLFRKSTEDFRKSTEDSDTDDGFYGPRKTSSIDDSPANRADVFEIPQVTVRSPSQVTVHDTNLSSLLDSQSYTYGVGAKTSSLSDSPSYTGL